MNNSNSKKRVGHHVHFKDNPLIQSKRTKSKNSDNIGILLKTIRDLNEEKKAIIRSIGFGCILDYSCSSDINDIFIWLANQLDPGPATVTLENGFSFTLSSNFVSKILGIPCGSKPVETKSSSEVFGFVQNILGSETPTVEYLCSLLHTELDEAIFACIFMLAMLSAFLAPDGSGVANLCYISNLINKNGIQQLDWCTFVLNYLLSEIEKHQLSKRKGIHTYVGGCKIILVISYFEFLITSEFNLGTSLPRLPLWTTDVVNSYLALDSVYGLTSNFGRLGRKHISSTPFKDTPQHLQMPAEIHEYIGSKLQLNSNVEERKKIQCLCNNFFQLLVKNSIPTMKSYIDDILRYWSPSKPSNHLASHGTADWSTHTQEKKETNNKCTDMVVFESRGIEAINNNEFYFYNIKEPVPEPSRHGLVKQLVHQMYQECIISEDLGFPDIDYEFERSLQPEILENTEYIQLEATDSFDDFLKKQLEEIIAEVKGKRDEEQSLMSKFNFDIQNLGYFLPAEENRDPSCHALVKSSTTEGRDFQHYSIEQQSPQTAFHQTAITQVQPTTPAPFTKCHEQPNTESVPGSNLGLSLNERLRGRRIKPQYDKFMRSIPSFEIMEDESQNNNEHPQNNADETNIITPSNLETVDPLLKLVLDKFGNEMLHSDNITINTQQIGGDFRPSSFINVAGAEISTQQVIFSNELEHEFYMSLVSCKQEFSPRIFEIQKIWVDQRTLSLSMSPGGWIHPHVIDCFGKLTTTQQLHRLKKHKMAKNDVLVHILIKDDLKVVMDPTINCADPKYRYVLSTGNVGFRLENAGLVHIPCPYDKQWILIVANFMDETFDVLNPDHSRGKFANIVSTVTVNFKKLFTNSYPGSHTKIMDFKVRYIQVPRFNFRYDSGIFIMQFIRWYNGLQLRDFSNSDVRAIREKISCQLVINIFNEHQVPIAKQFMAKHFPELLH